MKKLMVVGALLAATVAGAEQVVKIDGVGAAKVTVQVNIANAAYANCLSRNLELSGVFSVAKNGSVKVSGGTGAVVAEGSGKRVSSASAFADDKSARTAARAMSDAMVAAWSQQKGFASDKLLFLKRGQQQVKGAAVPCEICVGYADGYDARQLTSDAKMTVFPRWMSDGESILYIGDKNGSPQIWQMNTTTLKRTRKWSFKGTPAGIAVSPDGTKVAAILSFQGNPELYVLSGESWTRLTTTSNASEGQPTWSPDGKSIAYVSDETRHPQIYVVNVATREKRRLTSRGSQNVDPDWGKDGRIAYITKRGGAQVAVMNPAEGDASATLVTEPGSWEHPSWSRDMRHLAASRDRALFVVDTLEGGDKPVQIRLANANWISPSWMK